MKNPKRLLGQAQLSKYGYSLKTWLKAGPQVIRADSLSALLLVGPQGSGTAEVVMELYLLRVCSSGTACGTCPPCQRVLSGQWPDLRWMTLEEHQIDGVREVRRQLGHGPLEPSSERWFVWKDASELTTAASNALLKILEEPPQGWRLVLCATSQSALLPTLLSRCVQLRLGKLDDATLTQFLMESRPDPAELRSVVRVSQGNADRAALLLEDDLSAVWRQLRAFVGKPRAEFLTLCDKLAQSDLYYAFALDYLEALARDGLLRSHSLPQGDHAIDPKALEPLPTDLPWLSMLETTSKLREYADVHLNKKLAAQTLLSPWVI